MSRNKKSHANVDTHPVTHNTDQPESRDRRTFLHTMGGATAGAIAAGLVGLSPSQVAQASTSQSRTIEPAVVLRGRKRARRSYKTRLAAAEAERAVPIPVHTSNGDEDRYPTKIGNYSKGLKHDPQTGEVDPAAYAALIAALNDGSMEAFEKLVTAGHFGNPDQATRRRQVNPQAAYAFDLEGTDSHQLAMRPAPAFDSAEEAGEMVELYWMALLRDVNFTEYDTHPLVQAACDDLSRLSDFRGPKQGGQVTPQTLFRDNFPGCTTGPYLSQFLLQPAPFGAQTVDQRVHTNAPNIDFMTTFDEWLQIQNGVAPARTITPGGLVFIRNGRDLAQYVHIDILFQAYFVACLVLTAANYPLNPGNPYGPTYDPGAGLPLPVGVPGTVAQVGFGTFGKPAIATLTAEPSTRALKAQWFQKWMVHRRLRPEEFGGRVEVERLGRANYPFHTDLTTSPVLDEIFNAHGSHLLPMAYPEGSPMHTSYASGHATVAGACITMVKALFDGSAEIKDPVVPSPDGQSLVPYEGEPLTVGGELNKLASNIAQGRNIAGVHWRTDATEGIKLGEAVAISILRDMRNCYSETFNGFTFTKFDGTEITV